VRRFAIAAGVAWSAAWVVLDLTWGGLIRYGFDDLREKMSAGLLLLPWIAIGTGFLLAPLLHARRRIQAGSLASKPR
jgi:hypothetical protein